MLVLVCQVAFSQENYYIKLDSAAPKKDFIPYWKTALFNQVVAVLDNKNAPIMLIMLPANGSHSPVTGTYPISEGSKRTVKKGSQIAKLEFEPSYISAEGGGNLVIEEKDGIYSFTAENVTIINEKSKETHKLSFRISMFIEKK